MSVKLFGLLDHDRRGTPSSFAQYAQRAVLSKVRGPAAGDGRQAGMLW